MKSTLLLFFLVSIVLGHEIILPSGITGEVSGRPEDANAVIEWVTGCGNGASILDGITTTSYNSLLEKSRANYMFMVHGVDSAIELPSVSNVLASRGKLTVSHEAASHYIFPAVFGASQKGLFSTDHSLLLSASTSAQCTAMMTPTTVVEGRDFVLQYSKDGFTCTGENSLCSSFNMETLMASLVTIFGPEIQYNVEATTLTVNSVTFDLTQDAELALVSECALISSLSSVISNVDSKPLPIAVFIGLHGIKLVQQKFGVDSAETAAARLLVDTVLSSAIKQLEVLFEGYTSTEVLFVGSNCECEQPVPVPHDSRRHTLSISKRATASSSSSDEVVTANQAGNDQIIIWLTVFLIGLVLLSAYVMVAVGVDATKDTLLYFKTTTYH